MTEVIPGIYQLQLPMPPRFSEYINSYLVQGDSKYLLIDTGWNTEESFDSLKRQLAEIDVNFKDISQIVITHSHADHYGLASKLKQLCQAKLAVHYLEKKFIDSRYTNTEGFLQQVENWLYINGGPANELPELRAAFREIIKLVVPIFPDITLYGNETISIGLFNFKVIWTPGHTAGHISLYEPTKKVLIAGDHILSTITPNISLHPHSSDNPLGDYINSLNKVKQLDVNLILPGHGNPFTGLQLRSEEIIQHHKRRNSEILETIKVKPKTAYQISTEITWVPDTNGVGWQQLDSWNRVMAIMETMAHLESIRVDGKTSKFQRNGVTYYQSI